MSHFQIHKNWSRMLYEKVRVIFFDCSVRLQLNLFGFGSNKIMENEK